MRAGKPGAGVGATPGASNFSKMVSGRAGQSTRKMDGRSSGSGRRSRKKKKDDSARVIVDGRDVTPLPLMSAGAGFHPAAAMFAVGGQSTADMSALDSTTEHGFGGGSLAHGGGSAVSGGESEHQMHMGGGGGDERDWATNFARAGMQFEYALDVAPTGPVKAKEWTDRELREKHTIKIEETETITLFHLPGLKIWTEDEAESAKSLKANANYLACLEKHKEKDKYSARAQQTYNPTSREKEVQVAPPSMKSVGCDVSTWDIFDLASKLDNQVQSVGPGGFVPRIQHESDLLARIAANAANGSGAALVSRAEEEEEELLARASGGAGGEGARGAQTGASNTPSVHSAQQSFHGNAGQSFRSGSSKSHADRSWHQNINLPGGGASGAGTSAGGQSGNQSSHAGGLAGGASQSGMGKSMMHGHGGAGGSVAGGPSGPSGPKVVPLEKLLSKTAITRALRGLEQAVLQNTLHEAQLLYRNHPEASDEAWLAAKSSGPKYEWKKGQGEGAEQEMEQGSSLLPPLNSLTGAAALQQQQQHQNDLAASNAAAAAAANSSPAGVAASMIPLWSFSCPLTAGLNVACLSWNKQNLDLLAAGYGSLEFGHSSRDRTTGQALGGIQVPILPKDGSAAGQLPAGGGLILFWSLKNPSFPQKIFYTKSSVTSLDFSDEHPHLLAAGMYDGSVAIYDIRDQGSKPALESSHSSGKHSEPVWGVKFVAKELHKRSQQLTSISTDGSVKQWSMKKGLVPHELMQLKRMTNRAQLQGTTMEGLSREASGMCFDFPINDGTQYFAGTEDGLIHKCSVSYNEQTLENFYGHTGPVYKVRCSPFLPDAFLSCSADWSAMLWSQKVTSKPVLKFASGGHDYITDIVWSGNQACMFGMVSREGRVEIWDLDVSPLDPVIKYQMQTEVPNETPVTGAQPTGAVTSSGPSGLTDATSTALSNITGSNAANNAAAASSGKKRYLSCMAFSSNAPVVLVGTSDGAIELFRLEGTALTSVPPSASGDHTQSAYGQELNAATVMQVPRDRERDAHSHDPSHALQHEEQARLALEVHQQALIKFKSEAKKLEAIMEQHNESKNKLQAALAGGAEAQTNGSNGSAAVVPVTAGK
jgi:WD40 repeat protein